MASAVEKYEDEVLDLVPKKQPRSIPEAVEMKMQENNINQSKLATEMSIGNLKYLKYLQEKENLTCFL